MQFEKLDIILIAHIIYFYIISAFCSGLPCDLSCVAMYTLSFAECTLFLTASV